ncbi:gasdermin-A3 [Amia ocellicauda]|uniref:gasdermin-A3 n=1 Tax=Amia ocellicauda TaxID=2972642 RepID=UPI00346413DC
MFKRLTTSIVKELDTQGELQPAWSIYENHNLDLLYLLKKTVCPKWVIFKKSKFQPTGVKLESLLCHGDTVDIGKRQDSVARMSVKHHGSTDLNSAVAGGGVEAEAQLNMGHTHTVGNTDMERVGLNINQLRNKLEECKFNVNHWLLRSLQNSKVTGLYVIYEVLRAKNTINLEQRSTVDAGLSLSAVKMQKFRAKAKGQSEQKMDVEAGAILAFKALRIFNVCKQPCFLKDQGLDFDGAMEDLASDTLDFPALKRQVQKEFAEFENLDKCARKDIWGVLSKIIMCDQALTALDYILEEGGVDPDSPSYLDSLSEGNRGSVQELLRLVGLDPSDAPDPNELMAPFNLLVNAFIELEGTATNLICSLNTDDCHKQLKLVEWLLQQVYSGSAVPPDWTVQFPEDSVRLAGELLEACGLQLSEQRLDPSLGTPGSPDLSLLSFYIALQGLDRLLEQ